MKTMLGVFAFVISGMLMFCLVYILVEGAEHKVAPRPNCRLKDSLYTNCNSQIKAYNGDSLMYTGQDDYEQFK